MTHELSRRRLLQGVALAGGAAVVPVVPAPASAAKSSVAPRAEPFEGAHQAGILSPAAPVASFAAFDVTATSVTQLRLLMQKMTFEIRQLMGSIAPDTDGPASPPSDNGILGPTANGGEITITVGAGSTLFDHRFGLGQKRPVELTPMRVFPNDNLQPALVGGDLIVQIRGLSTDVCIHALRQLMQATRAFIQPRWRIDGFNSPARPSGTSRNLFGFKDGIANPATNDSRVTDDLVWAKSGSSEPSWTDGGTYLVVRRIRMLTEFWDRVSLNEQEAMIGRRRDTGAPFTGNSESSPISYSKDPHGILTPRSAHIRLANPRTTASSDSQILRRGYNYDAGIDLNGNLDMGLIFTCYQQDIQRQFEANQTRLIDEPLVDYVSPIGGSYFFVFPGVRSSRGFLGEGLFTS